MRKTVFLLILLTLPRLAFSQLSPGSTLWYTGFNAGIASTGFAGVGSKNSAFYALVNPATIATTSNMRIITSGSMGLPNYGVTVGLSAPISPGGIFYTATQFLSYDSTVSTHMGYGKTVRSDFSIGLEGNILFNTESQFYLGGGFNIGTLYTPVDPAPFDQGWGFKDFSFGTSVRVTFRPTSKLQNNLAPMFLFRNGIEATIMEFDPTTWRILADYAIGVVPLPRPNDVHFITWGSLGTAFKFWDIWELSFGTILGTFNAGFGNNPILPFTVGTSLGYDWGLFSLQAYYNLGAHEFFNQFELRHTVGIEVGLGEQKSPTIKAILKFEEGKDTNYISPNNDLVQDTVALIPLATGNINAWKLTIENQNGIVVRTYEGEQSSYASDNYVGSIIKSYFVPNRSELIPDKIVWDGKNQKNSIVPDGVYHAILRIRYQEDKHATSLTNTIIVDTTAPTAIITPSVKTLNLGDDPRAELKFTQEMSADPWHVVLVDQKNNTRIAQWVWSSEQTPTTNTWKLANPLRPNIQSGQYAYIASSYDKAGNFSEIIVSNINIEIRPRTPSITSDEKYFSPNNDDNLDFVKLYPDYQALLGLTNAQILIYSSKGEVIYTNQIDPKIQSSLIIWNGKDDNGKKFPDDTYFIVIETMYDDGAIVHSNPHVVTLDTTPPSFTLDYSPTRFSPDLDNINDFLTIDFTAEDITSVGDWTLTLTDSNSNILESFYNKESVKQMVWIPKPNHPLNSGDTIYIDIKIRDVLNNSIEARIGCITIDTLLDPTDKNLILTKKHAYFDVGQAVMNPLVYEYIDTIWDSISSYPSDKIKILARAYNEEAQNSDYEAYRLAILRGDAIKAYLIRKGINEKNITIDIQTAKEKNPNKQKDMRRIKIYLEKDPETLK